MSRKIEKECSRCGAINNLDIDDLQGMPLRVIRTLSDGTKLSRIVNEKPRIELDKPIFVQCEQCRGPFMVTEEDINS